MKALLISTALLAALTIAACSGGADSTTSLAAKSPTATAIIFAKPEDALKGFMLARLQRQDQVVLGWLTEKLRRTVATGQARNIPVMQVSNPCWYRYELEVLDLPTPTSALARVRVYQHFWGGDAAGGPPRSWEQEVHLVKTGTAWRVDQLGAAENELEERGEPVYGQSQSACNRPQQSGS